MSARRLRFAVRPTTTRGQAGTAVVLQVRAFGVRVGYWPCLKAPFVEILFNTRRYQVWFGLPSYR